MQKVLVIVGPTAIGKTSFGINIAKLFNGEIISGDSVQIYKGFDIGSGKVKEEEKEGIIHYLIDEKEYYEDYNVREFQKDARLLIDKISKDNKLPIIVGGTGLYIKATLYDYIFNNEDTKDNQYEELSNEDIYNKLKEVDPKCLEKIHINNRQRLVRALNVYEKNHQGISKTIEAQNHEMIYDALIIGLTSEREIVYERINKRVDIMMKEGLLNEIETLLKNGVSFNDKPMTAIGYKQFKDYFEKKKTLDEVIGDIKRDTRRFAKRQYTWFNNQTPIRWYDIGELDKAIKDIREWYE